MRAPETRGGPILRPIHHKGQVWKPDNLIVLSSRFIINIFIKLIVEKSPGPLNSRQIHLPRAQLTANNGVVSEIGPGVGPSLRPHDRQIACLCRDDMGNLGRERRKKNKTSLFGDNHNCTLVLACGYQVGEKHERGIFCLRRAENTCCCTSGFTNHSSKRLSLSLCYHHQKLHSVV